MGNDRAVAIAHDGVFMRTERSVWYKIDDRQVCVPRSQLIEETPAHVTIPAWLAEKEGLEAYVE